MNTIQKSLYDMLISYIVNNDINTEVELDQQITTFSNFPMFNKLANEEVEAVRKAIKAERSISLAKGALIEESKHQKWFMNQKSVLEMRYWERYKKYLLQEKGFSTSVVNTLDDILDLQVDLLGDPKRNIGYQRRGLVIGDVQSGKTSNYTGLICKAVDSQYKVIVLLTGTIEKLRRQTQQRLDEGFVGADSAAMMKQKEVGQLIGVSKFDPSIRPMVLTSTLDDFKAQNAKNLGFDLKTINGSVLFVVKKNVAVLKRLNKWLKTFNQNGKSKIEHSILTIDDEADNASVNTNPEDRDPTAINKQIRELLKMFEKASYVGYTATPFANIFIDPETKDALQCENLFPKDYIYSLNAPSNYIGARNIFAPNGNKRYMLMEIDTDDKNPKGIEYLIPIKHKSDHYVTDIPEDMEKAIETFLLANVIRDLRGDTTEHRSMLINISRLTDVQRRTSELVNNYLKNIQSSCKLYTEISEELAIKDPYIKKLYDTYNDIYGQLGIEWEKIQNSLHKSVASIKVVTINQKSEQNLNYEEYEKSGLRVIAVGGLSLSRGLTLEGLIVSYFYRNSRMYDTLMQMGRWFGYRKGYDDLCRIWMTAESIEWYRHISEATDELREEVKKYEDSDLTPLDFGLRVRSDINTLLVTARNKMRSASQIECSISLSETVVETPEIYSDRNKNISNEAAVRSMIENLIEDGFSIYQPEKRKQRGFKSVPTSYVIDFLEQLDMSPKNAEFNGGSIINFINEYKGGELKTWDIAFASGNSDRKYKLADGIEIPYVKRSFSIENHGKIIKMSASKRRLGTSADGKFGLAEAQIKLVEKRKENVSQKEYFVNINRHPLLTIYFVDLKDFKGESDLEESIRDNFSNIPLVGIGIGIPNLSNSETKYAKYVINKIEAQQMFDDDFDIGDDE